jgi:hypothetical protein
MEIHAQTSPLTGMVEVYVTERLVNGRVALHTIGEDGSIIVTPVVVDEAVAVGSRPFMVVPYYFWNDFQKAMAKIAPRSEMDALTEALTIERGRVDKILERALR